MKAYIYIPFFLICLLDSCQNNSTPKTNYTDYFGKPVGATKQEVSEASTFLSDSEIESIIQANDPILLSFWIGMTEEQSNEILRYLIDKGDLVGTIYNSTQENYQSLSTKNIKNPDFKDKNRILYYDLTPNAKTMKGELDLNFKYLDGNKKLDYISLGFNENIEYSDFEDLIKLYKKKYGPPINVEKKKPKHIAEMDSIMSFPGEEIYRCYSFKKDNKLVSITYRSGAEGNGLKSPNGIQIVYQDRAQEKDKDKKFIESLDKKNEENEKLMKKSLNKI